MDKKTVIITGATTGIGKSTALAFAKAGYNVVITSRNQTRGDQTIGEIKATGAEASFMVLDVTSEGDFAKLIDDVVAKYGKLDAKRSYKKHGYTTLQEHMPQDHQSYFEQRGWTG